MLRRHAAALLVFALLSPTLSAFAQQPTPAPAPQAATPALDVVARIKDEGVNRSHVMETLDYLTNVIGPRLTGSPALKRANNWTRERLAGWGLQNAHLEAWGPFGRGWTLRRFSAEVVAPQAFPLLAYPRAWSPNAGGSDFLSFNAVGLNGFDFLQDEIEYETRTWHTNQDTYDRIIPEDVKEAAVIVATFIYNAAMADEKLPRKPSK